MKCKICGGELKYTDGFYVCDSCSSKFSVNDYYNDSEVFLLFTESDENERRTKSSIIAQEIYNKIESKKAKIFYPRIHIGDLTGADYIKTYNAALASAKIVVLIATSNSEFQENISQYSDFLADKQILPVYSDMDAYDIPEELNSIQALPYNKVGAIADLERNILRILGRADEYDIVAVTKKTMSKKKKNTIMVSAISFVVVIAMVLYIIFGTSFVLTSKKYSYAQKQIEKGKYKSAISMLYDIKEYQESESWLTKAYSNYIGYYKDEENAITFNFNVSSDFNGSVELTTVKNEKQVKIAETFEMTGEKAEFSFNDSENNKGKVTLSLTNTTVEVDIKTEEKLGNLSFDEMKLSFKTSERSDKPFAAELDKEELLALLESNASVSEIKQKGIEIEFVGPLYKDTSESRYSVKNTEINFAIIDYDVKTNERDSKKLKVPKLFAISAPAKLLLPDKIGEKAEPFIEDDIIYVPSGVLSANFGDFVFDFGYPDQFEDSIISENTSVCVAYRKNVGEEIWSAWKNLYIKK